MSAVLNSFFVRMYFISCDILNSFRALVFFVFILCAVLAWDHFYLSPSLDSTQKAKVQITIERLSAASNLGAEKIINILDDITKVRSNQLWIHSMNIEGGKINLKVRGLDSKSIGYYVYEIENATKMNIEKLVIKDKNYVIQQDDNQEQEAIPFALKIYLEQQSRSRAMYSNNQPETREEKKTYDNILYYYEAEVVLGLPKNN